MSKSRGTFITAENFLKYLNPEHLRFYYASKIRPTFDDLDLNFEDFMRKNNINLIGKIINIASRCGKIIQKSCNGELTEMDPSFKDTLTEIYQFQSKIAENYESQNYNFVTRDTMMLADKINKYIDDQKPWELAKTSPDKAAIVCTTALNALIPLIIYLKPIIPKAAQSIETFLSLDSLNWLDIGLTITNKPIKPYEHALSRVSELQINQLLKISKESSLAKSISK